MRVCRGGARRNYGKARRNYGGARRNYGKARRNYGKARRNYGGGATQLRWGRDAKKPALGGLWGRIGIGL